MQRYHRGRFLELREKILKRKSKKSIEMWGKMENRERNVQKTHRVGSYMLELEGLFNGVSETLPEGFKMPKINQLDGTGNPKSHVCMCIGDF